VLVDKGIIQYYYSLAHDTKRDADAVFICKLIHCSMGWYCWIQLEHSAQSNSRLCPLPHSAATTTAAFCMDDDNAHPSWFLCCPTGWSGWALHTIQW